jgi:hypothetical protein
MESPMEPSIHTPGRDADSRDSNIIWFAEECLNNGVQLESYVRAAERGGDHQLAEFFRRVLAESRKVQEGDPRRSRLRHAARLAEFGSA